MTRARGQNTDSRSWNLAVTRESGVKSQVAAPAGEPRVGAFLLCGVPEPKAPGRAALGPAWGPFNGNEGDTKLTSAAFAQEPAKEES